MVFPKMNLPAGSTPWGREVQKRIEVTDSQLASLAINDRSDTKRLQDSYRRLDETVQGLLEADVAIGEAVLAASNAASDAAQAAADAAAAAATANTAAADAAAAAAAAADAAATANSAIAILSSLTSFVYYPAVGQSWTSTPPGLTIDYNGATDISIPESGGQRDVIVTAVYDVDLQTATGLSSGAAKQIATAYLNSGVNSTASGGNRGTNTSNISVYGGGSLSVSGKYTVSATGTLNWNTYLNVSSSGTGTFNGSAILRFVTVTITKV